MWNLGFWLGYSLAIICITGQDISGTDQILPSAIIVNLTLEAEDGYVDSRQITVTLQPAPSSDSSSYWMWTTFTEWSSCSVTCGPGLESAERFCVLVADSRVVEAANDIAPCLNIDHQNGVNITTSVASSPSQKRFRTCSRHPCSIDHLPPSTVADYESNHIDSYPLETYHSEIDPNEVTDQSVDPRDPRSRLCSKNDNMKFAGGIFYRWVPFHAVYAPCSLVCQPVGERFYMTFAEQVPDGMPCKLTEEQWNELAYASSEQAKSGVCLNGTCQAIGCDGIIGSSAQRDHCGVCNGDSTSCQKIRVDLFDNYPLGHNKIGSIPKGACNITLYEQKPTGNVFALRVARGYFLNGQWTASNVGDYPAAGTLFHYQHVTNGNSVRLHGEKITAPGPLTEDVDIILITKKPNQGVILEYSISNQRSQSWTSTSPNNNRRRHRADSQQHPNAIPQITGPQRGDIPSIAEDFVDTPIRVESLPTTPTPRPQERHVWSVAGYTACSRTCGKGIRHSNIVCMMERSRRILDDAYCENIIKPAVFQEQCNLEPCASEWHYGEWGPCSVSCGTGTQAREVRCKQPQGDGTLADVSEDNCGGRHTQGIVRTCQNQPCKSYGWRSGEWSPCDVSCGTGSQRRLVKCYDQQYGSEVGEENCDATAKPQDAQACEGGSCRGTWLMSDWESKCSNGCGTGQTSRNVVCFKDNRQQNPQYCDAYQRPETRQTCTSQKDCGGRWYEGPWSDCAPSCGVGSQTREVLCLSTTAREQCEVLPETQCKYHPKPETQRQCQGAECHDGSWYQSDWSPCSHSCGVGVRSRQVHCLGKNRQLSNDCPENDKPSALESCGNEICNDNRYVAQESADASFVARPAIDLNNKAGTFYDSQPENDDRRYVRPPVDLNNKAGTLYDAQPQQDYRRPIDLNNKAGTLYDAQPALNDDRRNPRPPVDLNNKAGTLYDSQPQQDSRPPIDLNNKAGTLYDSQPQQDYRPPVDLNNKAGTLYDAQPQQDYRPPVDLNNKAGTLYDAQPQQDYRRPIDLNNKAGTLYDAQPQQDYRPPVDLNNKAGTLYDSQPQQDYRPPVDLNNKAGTLYDAQPQQDYRPPIDLNNKAGTLYDAQPQQDYRPPVDLNNKAGTLYDAQPQQDYRPPVDLNNKAGTLYDAQPQQDYRPPVDLNNKAGTLYDAQPQQDYRPPVDLNNKAGTLYDAQPQQDYRRPIDLNNKAGTLFDSRTTSTTTEAPQYLAYQAGPDPGRGDTPLSPPSAARSSLSRRTPAHNRTLGGRVDIELPQHGMRVIGEESSRNPQRSQNGQRMAVRRTTKPKKHGAGCVDKIDRCKSVKELAFCRYDYYKKMCCKSCSQ